MEAPCSVVIPMELSEFGVLAATSLSHLFGCFIYHFCFLSKLINTQRFCKNICFLCQSILGLDLLYCLLYLCGFKLFHFC